MAIAYHTHQFEIPTASNAETGAGLVSDKVVVPSGLMSVLANYVTSTALTTTLAGYVQSSAIGVTVQAYDADLAAIAALASAADKVPYATGAGAWALADFTVSGRALVAAATVAAQRTALGLGTAATTDATAYATAAQGARADTAIQPGSNRLVPAGGTTGQVLAKTSATDYATAWTAAGAGDMLATVYDPSGVAGNAFNGFPVADRTALKALNTANFSVAYLTEAGREGQFIWRAGDFSAEVAADTAEGIYVKAAAVAATAGAWVRVYSGAVNVQWFGATGDGVTNDTAAIQSALDVAEIEASSVFVADGSYRIAGPITKHSFPGPVIAGSGPSRSILEFDNASASLVVSGRATKITGIHFKPTVATVTRAIYIGRDDDPGMSSEISGNLFGDRGSGCHFSETIRTKNLWYSAITGNVFGAEAQHSSTCIVGDYSVNVLVANNSCEFIGQFVRWTGAVHPSFGYNCEGWIISGNAVASCYRMFFGEVGLFVSIADNIIDYVYDAAIIAAVGSTCITGNWIALDASSTQPAVWLQGAESRCVNNRIVANNTPQAAIQLSAGQQVVQGNHISGSIQAVNCAPGVDYVVFTGNILVGQTVRAADMGGVVNGVYANNVELSQVAPATLSPSVRSDKREFSTVVTATSSGSATLEVVSVAVPSGIFSSVPTFAAITATNTADIYSASYSPSESTATSLLFRFSKVDGGSIPTAVGFSMYARE